ncbi:unnamed protein product [Caenorhabditis bovis]|uniref:Ig-like domain-containing protein n=1 Tax=Caenorhabditis bovis TaxID=2654633 RepID=A0A8S1FAA9_9PELO|nr:unnamed protein product [Caenorhabditis bovis]
MKSIEFILALVVPTLVTALGGRGSKSALNLIAARSSEHHTLHSVDAVTIWCTPDNPQVVVKSGFFVRTVDNKRFDGVLSANKKNVSYTIESPSVKDAGEYKCELDTPHGRISHKAYVYSRPVAHTSEHFTEKEGKDFQLTSTGFTIQKGESVNLTCPVTGYPKPAVKWSKNGAPLALSKTVTMEGTTIRIVNAEYSDAGTYSCEAINEYTVNQKTSKLLLTIDKMVNVKSEYDWVYPLAVILAILILLGLIIVTCEFRKKKQTSKN